MTEQENPMYKKQLQNLPEGRIGDIIKCPEKRQAAYALLCLIVDSEDVGQADKANRLREGLSDQEFEQRLYGKRSGGSPDYEESSAAD